MKSVFFTPGAFSLPVSFIFIPLPFLSSFTPNVKCHLGAITIYTSLAEQDASEKNTIYKFPSKVSGKEEKGPGCNKMGWDLSGNSFVLF